METRHTPKLEYGIWPDGSYVVFSVTAMTEYGTISDKDVLGIYGSAEEARNAITRATGE